ncbi:hypothetical protein ACO0M4_36875 [Streptomyces sp. RGM 3693]|uniref:hypothetical protein n=1 Tax=Streptomyces sp. RGM 3693 TaxID=3413284 RepID=UPI003D2B97E5
MTPPPQQDPSPYAPRRRPYGSVRLSVPIAVAPARPRPGVDARRWYGPRIPLPPLSMGTLRRRDGAGRRD